MNKITIQVPLIKRYNLDRNIAELLSLAARNESHQGYARNYLLGTQPIPLEHTYAMMRALESRDWFDDIAGTVSFTITKGYTNWEITEAEFRLCKELQRLEQPVAAIKFIRSQYGLGLKEGKDIYDTIKGMA